MSPFLWATSSYHEPPKVAQLAKNCPIWSPRWLMSWLAHKPDYFGASKMLGYFASQMHALPAFLNKAGANILAECAEHESQPKSCSGQYFNFKFVRFRYQYNYMAKTNTGHIYS
jgi:hypothetical protein